jgi:hypothetical protein
MRSRRIIQIRNYLPKLVIILAMLTGVKESFAAEEPYVNNIRGAGVVPGVVGTGFIVTDEKFLNSTVFYNTIRPAPYSLEPENIVELKLNYDTSLFFYDKVFTATVNLTILCYNNAYDTSQVFTQYNNVNLTIKHDSTKISPYKGVHFIKFSGASDKTYLGAGQLCRRRTIRPGIYCSRRFKWSGCKYQELPANKYTYTGCIPGQAFQE